MRWFEAMTRRREPADRPVGPARAGGGPGPRAPRIALYSHDTQGLGHIRRNLLISRAFCRNGATPVILLLSGLREASAFAMPAGVDCITLPSLGKGEDGRYFPRSLGVSMEDLIRMRSRAIAAALQSFEPDVFVVDKVPHGIFGELLPALGWLRANARTQTILGLREILDAPDTVRREWKDEDYVETIRAYYDRIWVYGDRKVYDTAREYSFPPDLAAMVRHSGYLNPRDAELPCPPGAGASSPDGAAGIPRTPYTLCLVGGGRDGLPLAEAFLRAQFSGHGVLVTGPLMPADARTELYRLAADRGNIRILEFITDPCPWIEGAERVIAMGGYNTVCEILAYGKPALIVPRTRPRTEQLIRAKRMAALGLVDMLHPDRLDHDAIARWLGTAAEPPPSARGALDFGGVGRLPGMLDDLMRSRRRTEEPTYAVR